ncbi:MAG: cupredoxin domain-containing protein [Candidatus Pacearchaeota archaeon]|nr:cupredoxin domain-containing protein [Candidatus Pacearchaeota archaeon]
MRAYIVQGILLLLLVASLFVIGAGCEQQQPKEEEKQPELPRLQATVTIKNFTFNPQELRVNAGTKVTWINEGTHIHRITNNQLDDTLMGGLFDISIKPGEQVSYVFNKPGTYPYHCHLHPNMKGTVIVE